MINEYVAIKIMKMTLQNDMRHMHIKSKPNTFNRRKVASTITCNWNSITVT